MHNITTMKNRLIIFLSTIILFLSLSAPGHAEDFTVSPHEQALLEMINEAREDPLNMATSMGMDADQILQDFPELEDILTEGLPPLSLNQNLYEAASAHTKDMLDNGYYAHDSLDGRTYDDRIIESGYDPVVTGESLGMLGFANFIDPDEAVRLIFENMFRDELNPTGTEKRNILNPELREVGVSLCTGAFNLGGSFFNVYLTTCDFASSEMYLIESELLILINQARENPLAMATSLGMDTDKVIEELPELREILTEGLPPLTFNRYLYTASAEYLQEMIDTPEGGHRQPPPGSPWYPQWNIRTYDDRIREHGYSPILTGEIAISLESDSSMESAQAAMMLFEAIFKDELNPDREGERNILNPLFKEVGISFGVATLNKGEELIYTYHLLVCDFGAPITEQDPSLTGIVYEVLDLDGLYSLGEGIPGIAVSIEGVGTALNLFTNQAGGFTVRLEPGEYKVSAYLPDSEVRFETVDLAEENQVVWFRIEIEESQEKLDM
jgi:uncharacterized protein YkwD